MEKELMHIGKLAKLTGITPRTIRYYEEISLLDLPKRSKSGTRIYDDDDYRRLKFILRLKDLGITLKEMQEIADLYQISRSTEHIMPMLIDILDKHIGNIDNKISRITALRTDISSYRQRILKRLNKSNFE
ncbi:MAG: MerR family transcriptional regulator [Deltaproteobacteria bacterium]|jgi:MerR family transcriptional regulator, repressor of the yfmOP operon|nr:MerR family transcriptional regulator [Deltaproteobacteria bacterium]MBT4527313.1 MerR family transcriptional regulator [Deltaproteobacteria bacterium]